MDGVVLTSLSCFWGFQGVLMALFPFRADLAVFGPHLGRTGCDGNEKTTGPIGSVVGWLGLIRGRRGLVGLPSQHSRF